MLHRLPQINVMAFRSLGNLHTNRRRHNYEHHNVYYCYNANMHKNMIKCALQFQRKSNRHCPNHYFTIIIHKSNQFKRWFLMRGENRSTRGKTSHGRVENQQPQSTYDTECGNRARATSVEGNCSHHQANPAT